MKSLMILHSAVFRIRSLDYELSLSEFFFHSKLCEYFSLRILVDKEFARNCVNRKYNYKQKLRASEAGFLGIDLSGCRNILQTAL